MNFINPYLEIYFRPDSFREQNNISFYKEVCWTFLKNIDNRLKLFQHRINIVISDIEPTKKTMRFGSIYECSWKLSQPFNDFPEIKKREKLLCLIYESFKLLGDEYNWDLNVIDDAYLKSTNQIENFEFRTENKLNRNKQLLGQIKFLLEKNTVTFFVEINEVSQKSNDVVKLFETSEDNLSWNRMFKEFGWFDNARFGLKFLNGELWIVLNIENGKVEELKRPKKFEIKKIDSYLEILKRPAYKGDW